MNERAQVIELLRRGTSNPFQRPHREAITQRLQAEHARPIDQGCEGRRQCVHFDFRAWGTPSTLEIEQQRQAYDVHVLDTRGVDHDARLRIAIERLERGAPDR